MKNYLWIALIVISFSVKGQTRTNFAGTFVINEEKVSWGEAPREVLPKSFKISQDGSKLTIIRVSKDTTNNEVYLFDGTVRKAAGKETKTIATLKWNAAASGFILEKMISNLEDQPVMEIKEEWSLEDGGKTLKVIRAVEHAGGEFTITGYFDRK